MRLSTLSLCLAALCLALPLQAASSRILFNGGITADERDAAPDNGTKLEFFVVAGNYLSAVDVTVTDAAGNVVVSTRTAGPWLILDLSPGTYQVSATRQNGDTQGGAIEVAGAPAKYGFMFPDN